MHTFQPYPIDLMEMNPFTKIGKEWMLITAGDEKKANTMTASWGGVGVLWGKNVVYIFVRDTRYTKEFIDNGETFSLTFLDESNKGALKYLGAVSGRDENKIENYDNATRCLIRMRNRSLSNTESRTSYGQ